MGEKEGKDWGEGEDKCTKREEEKGKYRIEYYLWISTFVICRDHISIMQACGFRLRS